MSKKKLLKISIITPSFNQEEFIERTIKSIVSQHGQGEIFELEHIIMDGGSTDGSVAIIKKYAKKYSCIKWISKKDKGQSDAINKGMQLATGDVAAWLNSDDEYTQGALKKVAKLFLKYPKLQWTYGLCDIVNENDTEIMKFPTAYKNFFAKRYSYSWLLIENFISQPATFWRRQFFLDVGMCDVKDHNVMDYDLWLRMGKRSKPRPIKSYLAHFRRYETSKSGSQYKKQFTMEYKASKKYTKNVMLHFLHWLNAKKIIFAYSFLDFLKRSKK